MCGRFTVTAKNSKKIADHFQVELEKALERLFAARPEAIPLLRRFAATAVEDVTIVGLPAAAGERPGCCAP